MINIFMWIYIYILYTHEWIFTLLLSGTMCIYTCLFWDVELCRKPRFFCLPRWGLGLPKSGWGSRQTWRIEGAIWDPRDDVGFSTLKKARILKITGFSIWVVATQIFFIFTPTWGNDPIWLFFSNGLKPPTRYVFCILLFLNTATCGIPRVETQ